MNDLKIQHCTFAFLYFRVFPFFAPPKNRIPLCALRTLWAPGPLPATWPQDFFAFLWAYPPSPPAPSKRRPASDPPATTWEAGVRESGRAGHLPSAPAFSNVPTVVTGGPVFSQGFAAPFSKGSEPPTWEVGFPALGKPAHFRFPVFRGRRPRVGGRKNALAIGALRLRVTVF